jgi:hypothetical protein
LFLADRNVLVNQTTVNDFRPFGRAMAKLSTDSKVIERADGSEVQLPIAIDRRRRIDTSYQIYLGLYQAITAPEDRAQLFRGCPRTSSISSSSTSAIAAVSIRFEKERSGGLPDAGRMRGGKWLLPCIVG